MDPWHSLRSCRGLVVSGLGSQESGDVACDSDFDAVIFVTDANPASLVRLMVALADNHQPFSRGLSTDSDSLVELSGSRLLAGRRCLGVSSGNDRVGFYSAASVFVCGGCSSSSAGRLHSSQRMMPTPQTMALSAILKLGHTYSWFPH